MMKINFSKSVKSPVLTGFFTLLLLFVGSSVFAQSQASLIGDANFKDLAKIQQEYGNNFMSKAEFKSVIRSEYDLIQAAPAVGATASANKAVKLAFLKKLSGYVRSSVDLDINSVFLQAYSAAVERSGHFTVNVNTLAIYEEYYDLFTL